MAETKKVRVPLTAAEVEEKGDELAKLNLQRVRVDQDRKKAARGYRVELKDLNEQIRNIATDRDTRTEEREFEAERRSNLKTGEYEWHRLDGGGIVDRRVMTKDELRAEQQLELEGLGGAKPAKAPRSSGSNGKLKLVTPGGESGKLVKTDANKRKAKGPAKTTPETQPTA